jgi:hypothetical protein
MHDLRTQLSQAAEQAAQRSLAPGAAAALGRARARRRVTAGAACALLLVVGAAGVALGRGHDQPTGNPSKGLPWRPLVASEWNASVPDERPLDPVVAAAQGNQAGQPWRLVVYRSVHQGRGQAAAIDVCYILDWFARGPGGRQSWQANGTCAPEGQPATVLAVGGPDADATAVIGRAPSSAMRIRLELRGRPALETIALDPGRGIPGRVYVTFVPRRAYLERMVALDGRGRVVGQAPGQGDLSLESMGFPPTGRVAVVAHDASTPMGPLDLTVWPVRDGFCVGVTGPRGGGGSSCDLAGSAPRAVEPQVSCETASGQNQKTVAMGSAYGGVPSATRSVRVEVAGKRFSVPAADAGAPFGRAFFLTDLPLSKREVTAHFTAVDAAGSVLQSWSRSYRCP